MGKYMPVNMIIGKNCVTEKGPEVFAQTGKSCLIVTGKHGAKASGALDDCIYALTQAGVSYRIFDLISENPLTVSCHEAGLTAREMNADFILGIGGGSALDSAKAVAIYAVNPGMTHDGIYGRDATVQPLPVILVGTTAGTGSEVTGVSVLTNPLTGRKKSISGKDCYAVYSFCDYRYTMSAKSPVTVSTALDAFAHAVESIFCDGADDESIAYSGKAIKMLSDFIVSGCATEGMTENDYERLYLASLDAGRAINVTGCAYPHTIGYYLTEEHGIPHGLASVCLMPSLLDRAEKYAPEKLALTEKMLGTDKNTLSGIIRSIIPHGMVSDKNKADEIASRWAGGVKNFDRSPGGLTTEEAAEALLGI